MKFAAWRYYLKFYRGHLGWLSVVILTAVAQVLILVPIPLLIQYIFDQLLPKHNHAQLGLAIATIIALYLSNTMLALWTRHSMLKISKIALRKFWLELLQRLFSLSRLYYNQADQSRLHSIINQDTRRLDVMMSNLIGQVIPSTLVTLFVVVILIKLNLVLSLMTFTLFPIIYGVNFWIGRRIYGRIRNYHQACEDYAKGSRFLFDHMDLTRLRGAEAREIERQLQLVKQEHITHHWFVLLGELHGQINHLLITGMILAVLLASGVMLNQGYGTSGEMIAFFGTMWLAKDHPFRALNLLPNFLEGHESLLKLYGLMIEDVPIAPYSGSAQLKFSGKIALDNVSFAYNEQVLFEHVNLVIHPGEITVVLGANGAGKSTLISLILGFYAPTQGYLYADGEPFEQLDMQCFRQQIGVVMQDSSVFDGTIRENLTYGLEQVSDIQLEQACRIAMADTFIQTLADGYDALVGERGVRLSGGQRQRLAIARALITQPQLLILDEPTNHLDMPAIQQLLQNLRHLDRAPAILMISHNPEVLQEADKLYVLRDRQLQPYQSSSQLFFAESATL